MDQMNSRITADVRTRRTVAVLTSGILMLAFVGVNLASAEDEATLRAEKDFWQERYSSLLKRADSLEATVERERELYADANRRNYRRGTVRHVHRDAMLEAQAELAEVKAELAGIQEEGRRAGAMPGWFYEVELERESGPLRPGTETGPSDEGRNPLYLETDSPSE